MDKQLVKTCTTNWQQSTKLVKNRKIVSDHYVVSSNESTSHWSLLTEENGKASNQFSCDNSNQS